MLIAVHNMTYSLGLSLSMRFLLNLVFVTAKNCENAFSTQRLRLRIRLANRIRHRKRVVAKLLL